MTFDKLNIDYKSKEQQLCDAYIDTFEHVKNEMRKVNKKEGTSISTCTTLNETTSNKEEQSELFIRQLHDQIYSTLIKLDDDVKLIVTEDGREKWSTQFLQMWELNKKEQRQMWENNLKNAFNRIFLYENRVESYKKKMRQEINDIFQLPNSQWTESILTRKFEDIFEKTLCDIKTTTIHSD